MYFVTGLSVKEPKQSSKRLGNHGDELTIRKASNIFIMGIILHIIYMGIIYTQVCIYKYGDYIYPSAIKTK